MNILKRLFPRKEPLTDKCMRREHRSCVGRMPHSCMFCAVLFMG